MSGWAGGGRGGGACFAACVCRILGRLLLQACAGRVGRCSFCIILCAHTTPLSARIAEWYVHKDFCNSSCYFGMRFCALSFPVLGVHLQRHTETGLVGLVVGLVGLAHMETVEEHGFLQVNSVGGAAGCHVLHPGAKVSSCSSCRRGRVWHSCRYFCGERGHGGRRVGCISLKPGASCGPGLLCTWRRSGGTRNSCRSLSPPAPPSTRATGVCDRTTASGGREGREQPQRRGVR